MAVNAHHETVRIAASGGSDPAEAARAVLAALRPRDLAGIMVFSSTRAGLEAFAAQTAALGEVAVVGCSTAGEITPWGVQSGLSAIGFPAADFAMRTRRFDRLLDFNPFAAHREVAEMLGEGMAAASHLGPRVEHAGLLLIDGLGCREELIAHTLRHLLEDVPMVGGSAGDGMALRQTSLLHGGLVTSDCAVITLLLSRRPLRVLRCGHHEATERLVVATKVDTASRTIFRLDGDPAAAEYARLAGVDPGELGPPVFAANPLMVRVGGDYYARAPMRAGRDGSLAFHSAIERGLVLRLGRPTDMRASLDAALAPWRIQAADAVIAFESVHNRIEADRDGSAAGLAEVYRRHRFVGFHGYGEQFRDLHLNRTLVGLAIGGAPE